MKFLDLESGRLLEVGAYLRLGAYYIFTILSKWSMFILLLAFNANNKTRRSNKARFLWNTLKKTPSSGKSLIRIYSLKWVGWGWVVIWVWLGGGGGGRLFEAGRLLTFSAFRMGSYSRWALIRGWALIRINAVNINSLFVENVLRLC